MEDKTRVRYKDDILRYLLEEYKLEESRAIGARDIARVVFNKRLTEYQVEELCEEMISDEVDILKRGSSFKESTYSAGAKTEEFLTKLGGYRSHYEDLKNLEFQEKMKDYNRKNDQDEINRLQKRNLTFFWVPIAISIIALIWSIFKPSNDTVRLDEIENRLNQFEKENIQLKEELQKVDMMLKSYESDSVSVSGS